MAARSGLPAMKPSDRPVSSTPVPLASIARRAARTRSTASAKSNSGASASPVESSIEIPAIPVVTARATLAATPSGSSAKPPSKSALIGRSTAAAIAFRCARASSTDTPLSGRPVLHANPELVVASAVKPRCARYRALPISHGFGITKQPASWSVRNVAIR